MCVFIVQGIFIGAFGSLLGLVLGVLGALNVSAVISWFEKVMNIQFLNADVYFISYLPSELNWQDVKLIMISAFIMTVLATIYPAWRASKVQPAEALRYE
jgi:lipoprotein-releasing system permease protein